MANARPGRPKSLRGDNNDTLDHLAFFAGANPKALSDLAHSTRWISVSANELVLDFHDSSNDVFFVTEGAVRVVVRTPLGQEVILGDLGPGEIFGEMAAIDDAPRSASIAALHTTRICRIPGAKFMQFVLRSPDLSLRLLRAVTARLRLQDERMTELALLPARHRLAAELLRLSRPRVNGSEWVISPPVLHHVLAARIGVRRETVTLAMSELARDKLAEVSPRAIVLPRPEALRAAIDSQLRCGLPAIKQKVTTAHGTESLLTRK